MSGAAVSHDGKIKVWYKLLGTKQPTKVFVDANFDIDDLKRVIKENHSISLSHCDAPKILVFPQIQEDAVANDDNEVLDPGEEVPTSTTSKRPLIVKIPSPDTAQHTSPRAHISCHSQNDAEKISVMPTKEAPIVKAESPRSQLHNNRKNIEMKETNDEQNETYKTKEEKHEASKPKEGAETRRDVESIEIVRSGRSISKRKRFSRNLFVPGDNSPLREDSKNSKSPLVSTISKTAEKKEKDDNSSASTPKDSTSNRSPLKRSVSPGGKDGAKDSKSVLLGKKKPKEDNTRPTSIDNSVKNKSGSMKKQRYIDDVLRRAKKEYNMHMLQQAKGDASDDECIYGKAKILVNAARCCHICHVRRPKMCQFACGVQSHIYCERHCMERLGLDISLADKVLSFESCPICCLQCSCAKCSRELQSFADQLKKYCAKQGVDLKKTKMTLSRVKSFLLPGSHLNCKRSSTTSKSPIRQNKSKKNPADPGKASSVKRNASRTTKNKLDDVAKEEPVRKQLKMGPGSAGDDNGKESSRTSSSGLSLKAEIFTQYNKTEAGKKITPTSNKTDYRPGVKIPATSSVQDQEDESASCSSTSCQRIENKAASENLGTSESEEDGNVDYCLICDKSGGLICCDKCPRAFHDTCLGIAGECLPDSWECPRCVIDEMVQEGDIKMGNLSIKIISKAFKHLDKVGAYDDFSGKVLILSKIHEMLMYLIDFDFGYEFNKPVDCEAFPDYLDVVQCPIDLGTISTSLFDGSYCKQSEESMKGMYRIDPTVTQMDMLIFNVLKDIESVYHNCFLYNVEASTVYRMAIVQQKRCHVIRKCSIDKQLNPYIHLLLNTFINNCKDERKKSASLHKKNKKLISISRHTPLLKNGHPISTPNFLDKSENAVGIVDPMSNMIVKQYSSVIVASKALTTMFQRIDQHIGGPFSEEYMNKIFHNSLNNPRQTIFGYRWLLMHDMQDENIIANNLVTRKGEDDQEKDQIHGSIIKKISTSSGATLASFCQISSAFDDWGKLPSSPQNLELFKRQYIHKNCAINNVIWKSVLPEIELKSYSVALENDKVKQIPTKLDNIAPPDAHLPATCTWKNPISLTASIPASNSKRDRARMEKIKKWDLQRAKGKICSSYPEAWGNLP